MEETSFTIRLLPQGHKIEAKKGERLLESLIHHNIFLRSDCGGKGGCGKCQVEIVAQNGSVTLTKACTKEVTKEFSIRIPDSSLLSAHIIRKGQVALPSSFLSTVAGCSMKTSIGVAIDLGTTTIAVYLCDMAKRKVLSSIAVKNPQALYGDDVMSRIGKIGQSRKKLILLQRLVVRCIEWSIKKLFSDAAIGSNEPEKMVVVGNPAMIHIFLGVSPYSIGISPYHPAFFESRKIKAIDLGFEFPDTPVYTLPQVSGFIGGDILSASLSTELENESAGTLLVDLGTNGELMLKGREKLFATSCATGPAFEGATLSCGMQAVPGAIDRVIISKRTSPPEYSVVGKSAKGRVKPAGICGSGVISAVAALNKMDIVDGSGLFNRYKSIACLRDSGDGGRRYVIAPAEQTSTGREISISQKDIRSVQLGKAALITGIEFLLQAAGIDIPKKIIIAGAFGSNLDKNDMLALGMLPTIDHSRIQVAGNSAGAGAIMALCNIGYFEKAQDLTRKIAVIDLATNLEFQKIFVQRLNLPKILVC